jgi:hypothetical protein
MKYREHHRKRDLSNHAARTPINAKAVASERSPWNILPPNPPEEDETAHKLNCKTSKAASTITALA